MSETAPVLHALLIGIDRYPGPADLGFAYHDLYGAVADVARVETYLRENLKVPADRITRLVAPHSGGDPARRPTHAHLIAALVEIETVCRPGEQALVYYSGHGGRAPTRTPAIKGRAGLDEVIAPLDIADPNVPYLRDVEIAAWLARLSASGVFVTMVLDCCHSGGLPRRSRRVRGSENVDKTPRPVDQRLANPDEIAAVWRVPPQDPQCDRLQVVPVRAEAPAGYALLAACRPHEVAVEIEREDGWGGALTDGLLAVLRRADAGGWTYRRLHAAVTMRLHADGFVGQTPVVDGELDRLLFGRERLPDRRGVEVLEVVENWLGARVRLATGSVHGTRRGEGFALIAAPTAGDRGSAVHGGAADAGEGVAAADRLAEAEVTAVGETMSWATLGPRRGSARTVRAGDYAILVDPGPLALRRTVAWTGRGGSCRPGGEEDRNAWLAALLADHGDGFLLAAAGGERADFEIAEVGGLLEIRDAGGTPIPNLGTPLPLIAPGTTRELVRRLAHLARYWNVRALENPDETAGLAGVLRLRVERLPDQATTADGTRGCTDPDREAFMAPLSSCDLLEVPVGARLRLAIANSGAQALNVAVLDLQPDWGIQRVYPRREAAAWTTLEPDRSIAIDLTAHLPAGIDQGVDVLKAIAASGPLDLSSLERPALDTARAVISRSHRGGVAAVTDPFGRLLAALGAERCDAWVRSGGTAPESWTTSAVEVRVVGQGTTRRNRERPRSTLEAREPDCSTPLSQKRRSGHGQCQGWGEETRNAVDHDGRDRFVVRRDHPLRPRVPPDPARMGRAGDSRDATASGDS